MSSVARDPRDPHDMAAGPIFIESEEEIPAVIERLSRAKGDEVPLVLPARSRFAQSRFNFQLLRDYSVRLGKRVVVISPDPAVQRMAEENGFSSYRSVDQYRPDRGGAGEPAAGPKVVAMPQLPATPGRPEATTQRVRVVPTEVPDSPGGRAPTRPPPAGASGQSVPLTPGAASAVGAAGAAAAGGAAAAAGGAAVGGAPPVPSAPVGPRAPRAAGDPSQFPGPPAATIRPRQQPPVRVVPSSRAASDAKRRPTRIKVSAPRQLPSRLAANGPSRLLLYSGAILVLLVGMAATAIYVPSAKVTLVTEASPFNADVQVNAEPNKPPIRVRTVTVGKDATSTQKATGVKTIPGAVAAGTVTYANNCPTAFAIPDGQVLVGSTGGVFAQKGPVNIAAKSLVGPPATVAAPIVAKSPGLGGNTPGGPAALQPAGDAAGCLVAVVSATVGGADEQKKTVVSTADYDTAKAALESQLRKQAGDDLTKQLQAGEKLADPQVTVDSAFKASKRVDEEATDFQATLSLKVEGALYLTDDVNRAFGDAIQKQLPAGRQLTGNKAKIDYGVSSTSAGGHLTFKGKATGYQAPRLDLQRVKSQLPGKSTSRARTDLAKLPGVRSVEIDQSPIKLPILPLTGSRIDLQYVVSQAPPTRSG